MLSLSGSIPANIMPFSGDLSIDEPQFTRHIDWLVGAKGTAGITCNGHAGEVASLSRSERQRVVSLAAEAINGRVPLIAGIYAESYLTAVELARDAKEEGADALLIFPLNALAFGGKPEMVRRHFSEIASAIGLPMVLFMFPSNTRMQYDAELLRSLLTEIPLIIAVKEWSLDIRVYERNLQVVRSIGRHVSMLTSFSMSLLPSLVLGADGILSGHGSVICDLHADLLEAVHSCEMPRAEELYTRIQKLARSVYQDPFVDVYTRTKEQLVMLGRLDTAISRPPLLPITDREKAGLRQALRDAGMQPDSRIATHA